VFAEVDHGEECRTAERLGFHGRSKRCIDFVHGSIVGRDPADSKTARRIGVDCLRVHLIFHNCAVSEQLFHERHNQVFAEHVNRVVRSIVLQLVNRNLQDGIRVGAGMPVVVPAD